MTTTPWSFGRRGCGGWRRWLPVAVIGAFALVAIAANPAAAHAGLQSADPPDRATLAQTPAQVILDFTGATSATRSNGTVTDGSGAVVSTGWSVEPSRPSRMLIVLRPGLPDGVYAVNWRTLDEADNTPAGGTLAFTIRAGAATPAASMRMAGDEDPASNPQTPWYIVAVAMFGLSGVLLAVALLAFRVKERRVVADKA